MTQPVITWHASRDGLTVYRGGKAVAVVEFRLFAQLIYDLVKAMR